MKREELVEFVKRFNKVKVISSNTILKCMKELNNDEKELFLLLVNHKNGKSFKDLLDAGEI